jgi:hypothetical protein
MDSFSHSTLSIWTQSLTVLSLNGLSLSQLLTHSFAAMSAAYKQHHFVSNLYTCLMQMEEVIVNH